MTTYLVSYDLSKPGQNYPRLIEAIKSYGNWAHVHKSTWAVATNRTADQVRDHLVQYLDRNDNLSVIQGRAPAAWYGLSQEISDWLKRNLT